MLLIYFSIYISINTLCGIFLLHDYSSLFWISRIKQWMNFVKKFYTDNYTFDQNACNSSHLVFWIGKKKDKKLIDKFWIELNSYGQSVK